VIQFVSGDILRSRAQVIAHGVAPHDPMTQGLALALRLKFPALHKDFHHWCSRVHPKPGAAWMWGGPDGVRVVSLITQQGGYGLGARPGRATAQNVRDSLRALVKMAQAERFTSIAVPRLATGVGALSWDYAEYKPGKIGYEPAPTAMPCGAVRAGAREPEPRSPSAAP
jgi:O-acetyl-ADP-ribose deacetylase (regulator of RNase III)